MQIEALTKEIESEFDTDRSEAQRIAEKSSEFADYVQANSKGWEGPSEINTEYIISRLNMAPDHLSATAKWNWWAGIQEYLDDIDYKL